MSFSVIPQCAVTEIHDSSYCSKRHFGRQEMSLFQRIPPVIRYSLCLYTYPIPMPYSGYIYRSVCSTVWSNFHVGELYKNVKRETVGCGHFEHGNSEQNREWLQNPNLKQTESKRRSLRPDVKVIVDLPPFRRRKEDRNRIGVEPDCGSTESEDHRHRHRQWTTSSVIELRAAVKLTRSGHAATVRRVLDLDLDADGRGHSGSAPSRHETVSHIPCLQRAEVPEAFAVGVFVGASGSGKTSTAERLFGRARAVEWDSRRSVISHFESAQTAKELFAAMALCGSLGLCSFQSLSVGEQHRVNMARLLEAAASHERAPSDTVIVDEFTSSLDRQTAHKVAVGIAEFVERRKLRRVVLLSSKRDFISNGALWPSLSWLFELEKRKMTVFRKSNGSQSPNERRLRPPPPSAVAINFARARIRMVFRRCDHRDFSPSFSKHHYMDATIQPQSQCFLVWAHFGHFGDEQDDEQKDTFYDDLGDAELVGFTSIMHHFGQKQCGSKTIDFREHRTVVLPAFQGLGFGSRIADGIGSYLSAHGLRLHSKTAHPRYGGYRDRTPSGWLPAPSNGLELSRKAWRQKLDRYIFGKEEEAVKSKKRFFVHLFMLKSDAEWTPEVERYLAERVIVKRKYHEIH